MCKIKEGIWYMTTFNKPKNNTIWVNHRETEHKTLNSQLKTL